MISRIASDPGIPTIIAVSVPKGSTLKGLERIEISVSGKATADEFRKIWVANRIYTDACNLIIHQLYIILEDNKVIKESYNFIFC
jgi:hypothetical protein